MNKQTLKALKGSIKKWEGIVAGLESDRGTKNCPLCKLFQRDDACDGCPIKDVTGKDTCDETPYEDWCDAVLPQWASREHGDEWDFKASDDETVMCAVLELEFLKSLLPGAK